MVKFRRMLTSMFAFGCSYDVWAMNAGGQRVQMDEKRKAVFERCMLRRTGIKGEVYLYSGLHMFRG